MRRNTPLTAEFVRSILDYDPGTGIFRWRFRPGRNKTWNTRYAGQPAGTQSPNGYIYIQIGKGENYMAHQLAWVHYYGVWPADLMDHENGNRSDNRIARIREADPSQNAANKAKQRNNTSGHVGVSFDPQRKLWRARINYRKQMHDLGFYETPEEGAEARKQFLRRVHGEFTTAEPDRAKYPHARDVGEH